MQGIIDFEDSATYQPVDNYEWLEAVGDFVERSNGELLSMKDMLGAFAITGVETDLTDAEKYWAGYHLESFGFVRRYVQPRSRLAQLFRRPWEVSYQPHIPDWTVAEIAHLLEPDL
jgi:hypothetical protein